MTPTAYIALALGCFFLLVAIVKGFASRADRRRLEAARSAALNGGTPDAPVHLESPFPAPPSAASAPSPRAAAPGTAPAEETYAWE